MKRILMGALWLLGGVSPALADNRGRYDISIKGDEFVLQFTMNESAPVIMKIEDFSRAYPDDLTVQFGASTSAKEEPKIIMSAHPAGMFSDYLPIRAHIGLLPGSSLTKSFALPRLVANAFSTGWASSQKEREESQAKVQDASDKKILMIRVEFSFQTIKAERVKLQTPWVRHEGKLTL